MNSRLHNKTPSYFFISDRNWKWVDEETKKKIQQESKDDGEFWISFKDFYHQFGEVTICLLGPDFNGDGTSDKIGTKIVF